MSASPHTEKSIFLEAAEIASPTERAAFLERSCGDNRQLRAAVEALLLSHQRSQGVLDATAAPLSEHSGKMIGPYKLLQQIGEGGMGTVYMAEQVEPVQRKVALKIIKPGMDTRQVIARFEAERQAVAMMDHPNIAKVLDAGTTDTGRPYFVMELVKGVPITKYCDEKHLPLRARLELFMQVCQAVQHAHQKGIIHRDIKPNNVLVAEYDNHAVPKVIDFGVAKATAQKLTERTMFTEFGQVLGTMEYMSPEQSKFNQLDIDTRSDIYSLGVLLYELLAGSTPFEGKRLHAAAFDEMLRIIREEEPPKPSTRLSSIDTLPSVAVNRHTEPARLSKDVRGELDWIVMKALEKDRNRRYETASGFAADIERHLHDEPVEAGRPSAAYRFRKFARRNKRALVAATVLGGAFVVVIGAVAGSVGWVARDREARQMALEQQITLALNETERWQEQAKWPEALSAVKRAMGLLASGGSDELGERTRQLHTDLEMVLRLEEIRLLPSEWKDNRFDDEAADRAYAQAFSDYGIDMAGLPLEGAAAQVRSRPGVALALVAALDDWASSRRRKDKAGSSALTAVAQAADSDPWRRQVRDAHKQQDSKALESLAASPQIVRQPPTSLLVLAEALYSRGLTEARIDVLRRAQRQYPGDFWINFELGMQLSEMDPHNHDEAVSFLRAALAIRPQSKAVQNNLGLELRAQGKLDEAIASWRKAIELDPKFAFAYNNLALALKAQGKLDEAISILRKAIEIDPKDVPAHYGLGILLKQQGKLDEAISSYQTAIKLDPKHAGAHNNLAGAQRAQGKLDEAIASYRRAIEYDPKLANAHRNLGNALVEQKNPREAIAAYRKAVEVDPKYVSAHYNLAINLKNQGELDEAIASYRKAIELAPKYAYAHSGFGTALQAKGLVDEAIASYRTAIELDPQYAAAHNNLGIALFEQKKLVEADVCFRKAIELDPKYAFAHYNLGNALHGQGKLDEASACFRKAVELDPNYVNAHFNLGNTLNGQGKQEEAISCYRRVIELDPKHAGAHYGLGNALTAQTKPFEAVAAYREALRFKLANTERRNYIAYWLNHCAWELATNPDPRLRDGKRGVELAKEAIEIKPKEWMYWNTLGAAHYRAGSWKEAAAALDKSMELRQGGDGSDWFFLAMAHWQLGNKDEARQWYGKAVEWMEKQQTDDELLRRFRAEAEELLKITDKKPTTKPPVEVK